jgi:hypothetical protein
MMERIAVIKKGYVINVVEVDKAEGYEYPHSHDTTVIDTRHNVGIGDWYASDEDVFYRPMSTPNDLPEELK